jgi:hypothetical protein
MNHDKIIQQINAKIMALDGSDVQKILDLLSYHDCEPMAAAERIAEYLNVSSQCIFELITKTI